ncbi:MAG TPA: peroxide stress protein YaaA [Flavobacteriaceae bacterium]|nr:peroxide stress protein YaaA [Flavobacteriaceae bacterium]
MTKILLSPAKSLDLFSELPTKRGTQPRFLETTNKIHKKLARFSANKLSNLMGISPKLAQLNYQRNQEFEEEHTHQNSRPAMYLFAGDVYAGLDAYSISLEKLDQAQQSLRILSGLYGILRPLDLIQPYRLEMGTNLPVQRKKDLFELWRKTITDLLNEELEEGELLINLASHEYSRAVDFNKINSKVISPVFKDFKHGELKMISFFAKKARGSMARYILDTDSGSLEDLKNFNIDDYAFSEKETQKETEPVFIR